MTGVRVEDRLGWFPFLVKLTQHGWDIGVERDMAEECAIPQPVASESASGTSPGRACISVQPQQRARLVQGGQPVRGQPGGAIAAPQRPHPIWDAEVVEEEERV